MKESFGDQREKKEKEEVMVVVRASVGPDGSKQGI